MKIPGIVCMKRNVLNGPLGVRRSKDGTVPWPPEHVSNRGNRYAAYPGQIDGQVLGWVYISKKDFDDAVDLGVDAIYYDK